jgi:hypothetical protein
MSRIRVLTATGLLVAVAGCMVPCMVGALIRPGAGDSVEDRAASHAVLPWLAGLMMLSAVALWFLLAIAFGDWRTRRRQSGGRTKSE